MIEVDARSSKRKIVPGKLKTLKYLVGLILFCIFFPALVTFAKALRKDPAVSQLLLDAYSSIKDRTLSFLGKSDIERSHQEIGMERKVS